MTAAIPGFGIQTIRYSLVELSCATVGRSTRRRQRGACCSVLAHTDTDINLHQGHQYSPYRKECSPCRPQVLILLESGVLTRLERFLSLVVPAYIPTAYTSPPFPSESSPRDRSNGVRDNTAAPLPSSPPPPIQKPKLSNFRTFWTDQESIGVTRSG